MTKTQWLVALAGIALMMPFVVYYIVAAILTYKPEE